MNRLSRYLLLVLGAVILSASPALAGEVSLSVAASLKEVINELTESFSRSHPGVKFVKNFGGSGTLAKQVENGAPSDLFLSANTEWVDYLKGKKVLDDSSVAVFTRNRLVFAGNPAKGVSAMKDLAKLDKIAIGSPRSVPAGEYAVEALRRSGMEPALKEKLVMTKDVRECLMYAERGEVDGAFVYHTDALQARKVKILFTVPQDLYPRVVYPMALTAAGARNKDARALFAFLAGKEAKGVLARYGFAVK